MSDRITKPIRLVGTEQAKWLGTSLFAILSLSGCIGQLPDDDSASNDAELALAAEIRDESRLRIDSSIVSRAVWINSGANGQQFLRLEGLRDIDDQPLIVTNASTREVIRLVTPNDFRQFGDRDGDVRRFTIPFSSTASVIPGLNSGFANIPCTIRVQTNNGYQVIPVSNVPQGCVGLQNTALGVLSVSQSQWDLQSQRLVVRGAGAMPQQMVTVVDASTGQFIGSDQANALGVWSVKARNLFAVPCVINVTSAGQYAQSAVVGAPLQCSTIVGQIPGGIPGFIPPGTLPIAIPGSGLPSPTLPTVGSGYQIFNQAPESIIQTPSADLVVPPGMPVTFTGVGFDPEGNVPLSYEWRFDGAFPVKAGPTATAIFTTPGVYRVSLSVRDSFGMIDPTPATRLVIVQSPSIAGGPVGTLVNQPPQATIVSPQQTNTVVSAGQAVYFAAQGFDPENDQITYYWNFGGGTRSIALQNPGNIIFASAGTYVVSLTAADSRGNVDTTPDYRTITVTGGSILTPPFQNFNQAPTGQIVSPASDVTIPVVSGVPTPIQFSATGFDPDNSGALRYFWNFGAAANPPTSTQQTQSVTFSQPGVYVVTMTVSDAAGLSDPIPKTRIITIAGSSSGIPSVFNQSPDSTIISPPSDVQVMAGQSVRFESVGSDPDNNNPLIYIWDFDGAMPNTLVQNPGDVVFSQPGSYRVALTVQDSQGMADPTPAIRNITVLPTGGTTIGQAPNGIILSPQIDTTITVGQPLNFMALGQDNDGQVVAYRWDFGGAAPASTVQNPVVTFSSAGVYRVTLTVTDNTGLKDSTPDVRTVTVIGTGGVTGQAPNSGIISPATDLTINRGDTINFVGIGVDGAGPSTALALTYQWNFGGLGAAVPSTMTAVPGPVTFNTAGVYVVTLTVKNALGVADPTPAQRTITVLDNTGTNRAPVASITSPQVTANVSVGQSLPFSGSAIDPDGDVVSYYWDFDGAAADSSQQNPGNVVFSKPGTYTVRLYATDSKGMRSVAPAMLPLQVTGLVTRSPVAPIATMLSPSGDQIINVGDTVNFNGNATDADNNTPLSFRWSFDGAAPGSSAQIPGNVTFNRVGTYIVSLTVRDSTGMASQPVTRTIMVRSGITSGGVGTGSGTGTVTGAPESYISSPTTDTTVAVGTPVTFNGYGVDPDSLTGQLTYMWEFVSSTGQQIAAPSSLQNPTITFPTVGQYIVRLTVRDATGLADPTPAQRIVYVTTTGQPTTGGTSVPTQQGVNGVIRTPSTDLTVRANTPVQFVGEGYDATNPSAILTYSWNFGTGASPATGTGSTTQTTFATPGRYVVTLTVSNSAGQTDATPAIRIITVTP